MSKKLSRKDDQLILRTNPYVESISEGCAIFTPEFKEKAHEALLCGERMAVIFEEHGIQPVILGSARINEFREMIQRYADRDEVFLNLRNTKHRGANKGAKPDSTTSRLAYMENKISCLEQEVKFLKKHDRQIRRRRGYGNPNTDASEVRSDQKYNGERQQPSEHHASVLDCWGFALWILWLDGIIIASDRTRRCSMSGL